MTLYEKVSERPGRWVRVSKRDLMERAPANTWIEVSRRSDVTGWRWFARLVGCVA